MSFDLLALRQCRDRDRAGAGNLVPWCGGWAIELKELFAAYVEAKQRQNVLDYDDLLLYWAQTMSHSALADDIAAGSTMSWSTNIRDTNRLQSSILLALSPRQRPHRGRDDAQRFYAFRAAPCATSSTSRPSSRRRPISSRSIALPLDANHLAAANGVIDLAKEALHQEPVDRPDVGYEAAAGLGARRSDQARCIVERILENGNPARC